MNTISRAFLLVAFVGACSAPMPPVMPPAGNATPVVFIAEDRAEHDVDKILASGKAVTLVFWQTWCATCRAEGPDLVKAARTYQGKMQFFGVVSGPDALVSGDEVQRISSQLGSPYPQIRDRDGAIAEQFRVLSTPTIIVLGKGRRELYRGAGLPKDWNALVGR